jgi:hypothetical protein
MIDNDENITYSGLNVGAKFIYQYELKEKLKTLPPVMPVAMKTLREATLKDAEMYHILEELV